VADEGYVTPTPIQAQAIPVVLAGRDLLGAAQTGTGKTAGFTLPLLQRLAPKSSTSFSPARHPVRCLIVTPTRELALQVEESVRTYGKYLKLKSTCIYGGVGMQPQVDALRGGVDVVVATPGRLLDHVQQKTVDLRQVEILVLDEADRMLDMGFIQDIRRILALLPAKRQNLLFSATFPDEIRKLAGSFMKDPVTVEVARRNTPVELIGQVQHPVASDRKRELLAHLVKTNDWKQVLVFTKTKHGANRLAQQLEKSGIEADAIHGNKSQNARVRALTRFKDNELRVLVATDIAARGLDIEALPHVVNYDMPHVAEDYVHRIGRTGRAGTEGEAVSLVSPEDRPLMAAIERLINRTVESRVIEGFEPGTRGAPSHEQPRREQRQQHRPQQQQRHGRDQQQPRRGDGQPRAPRGNGGQPQAPRGNGGQPQTPRGNGGQPQASRGNGGQRPPRRDQAQRRGPQPQHRSGRRNGGQGYISPELQAQIEEGRKLARQDVREDPVENFEPVQAPEPRRAPTVTHRATRGIRRVLGSLLGGGNKNDNEPGT
jgi:ATP-dependent RNA helicase RhlE